MLRTSSPESSNPERRATRYEKTPTPSTPQPVNAGSIDNAPPDIHSNVDKPTDRKGTRVKKLLLGSVIFFAISGCSKQLDYRNTELSNGMFYSQGENTPFTGKVTNVPLNILQTKSLSEMLQYASQFSEDSSLSNLFTVNAIASFLGQSANVAVLCDTNIEDGYLDGEAICATVSGKLKVADIEYARGTVEGAVTLYSLKDKSGSTLARASFAAGKLHGNFKIYGLKTNKVVSETNWKNDALDGESKGYSNDTGNLIQQGMIVNNQRDGEWKIYDQDTGKLARTVVYKDGSEIESQATRLAAQDESFKAKFMATVSTPTADAGQSPPQNAPVSAPTNNADQRKLDSAVNQMIERQIAADGGAEYLAGRKILEADFNGDRSPDAVVLYTIEGAGGGNSAFHTLQLFLGNQDNYVAQGSVVVDGATDIALSSASDIVVTSLTHSPDDPDCCPSMKSTLRYHVDGNQLRQMP